MVRFQGLRSSIRLYGLVTVTGIHDQPALDPVQISCVGDLDAPTVRVFISRLDAEIYCALPICATIVWCHFDRSILPSSSIRLMAG
ncbi:hypothetical protein C4K04_2787 [Pseudomonas chlororaphis]|uniref:Uncharacterized protein n=1 Tax=Pseudomonas chlororaphis TaxID=587753 RepID=A0A3G7TQB0_9PSED|nr:hypothetical protein C4K04_2787 [Pseudomonas chlororaphis]